jgi:hypothetical protein
VVDGVAALRGRWADEWGIPEAGECIETLRIVEELCRGQSDRSELALAERLRFQSLAQKASEHIVRAGPWRARRRERGGVSHASELRKQLKKAFIIWQRQKNGTLEVPGEPQKEVLDDEHRVAAIAMQTGLSESIVSCQLESITSRWIATFALVQVGRAFSRARRITERNLEDAMQLGTSAHDRARLLNHVIASCAFCMKLLATARKHVTTESDEREITKEDVAHARELFAALEANGMSMDGMF